VIGGSVVRKLLKKLGRDVVMYHHTTHPVARRMHLLERYGVNLVLDIGANVGHFGHELRSLGYRGRIVSFEPLKSAYTRLENAVRGDPSWTTQNCAIGSIDGWSEINVAANLQSSSLLDMLPRHLDSAPQSSYQGVEQIQIRRLDSVLPEVMKPGEVLYVKSDTQGYELEVVKGGEEALRKAAGVQMELSLVPLYSGETLLADMIRELDTRGFQLMSIEPAFADPATGQLLQVDGIFFRASPAHGLA
jgi:FkbM family methyltransferase